MVKYSAKNRKGTRKQSFKKRKYNKKKGGEGPEDKEDKVDNTATNASGAETDASETKGNGDASATEIKAATTTEIKKGEEATTEAETKKGKVAEPTVEDSTKQATKLIDDLTDACNLSNETRRNHIIELLSAFTQSKP